MDDVAGNAGQFAGGWSMTITADRFARLAIEQRGFAENHTGVGDFDVPLPLTGTPGVECRSGAAGHTTRLHLSRTMS